MRSVSVGSRAAIAVLFAVVFILSAGAASAAVEKRPLMRFPDVHGNTIVFVHGEDIWSVPAEGGVATRLTISDGEERFPKFSPDGKWIAFTGQYDGNDDVYVMSVHGGDIARVTYHPGSDDVVGWHPTKNKILFRSDRSSFNRFARLFLVSPDGTGLEELIMHEGAQGSFSPDGKRIAYARESREFATWKRYQGGDAEDIYIFDFDTNKDKRMTDFRGTDRVPMWVGDKVYFSSDREGVLNIYAYDTKTEKVEQITRHKDYDVRRPSADRGGSGRIVYELGGTLWLLDTSTGQSQQVPVEIGADAPEARPYITSVTDHIQGVGISPSGKRALIVARGEVFTVPKEHGPVRNLTNDSGARDKDAAWSPDGKWIAYLSDQSGEYEVWLVDPMGEKKAERITTHENGYRHTLRWSPDSKKIAFADQTLSCYFLDVKSKKVTKVDKAEYENIDVSLDVKSIYDFAWSPDSRWLAYSKMDADGVEKIYVYSLESGKIQCVSNGLFNDFGPAWSRDGKHLLFVSNRRFDPTFCDFEWEMVYKKVAGIYCLTLRKDGEPLLPPRSDEEELKAEDAKGTGEGKESEKAEGKEPAKGEDSAKQEDVRVEIDFDGLSERIEALPLPRGNFRRLTAGDGVLFYLDESEGDFNRFEFRVPDRMDLHRFSFEDREEKLVIADINAYQLSADGNQLVYREGEKVGIIEAKETESKGKPIDLSELRMNLDPMAEWRQIFEESWRFERDFYYQATMHGVDWPAMREKYGRLLPFVSCRQDIQYIVGELIGELSTSHTYVWGGEYRREAEEVNVGMLGADYDIDSGRYRFRRIYRVPDWTREITPPLSRPGVEVREGDYLLSVNGIDVTAGKDIYSYFQDLAGRQVRLRVSARADGKEAREYVVIPARGERTFRYLDWVERNRATCERESGGEIGYLHLPDTFTESTREFPKYYYAQVRKKGLVIDGRFNGGGLDPFIFLHRLDTEPLAYWTRRYSHDQTDPAIATRAHLVCLTNRQAGSGGDMLPMEFQMMKMGPVIGTRTWGGLVGVSMFIPMVDGGGLTVPDYRIYDPSGKWIVENEGVTPDIEIDLDPTEVARGFDAQLMKGIEVLKRKMAEDPRPWPKHEAFPVDR